MPLFEQRRDVGLSPERVDVVLGGRRGPITLSIDDAQEPEGFVSQRVKLMEVSRRDVDAIERRDIAGRVVQDDSSPPAYDHHGVWMVMTLQRGVTARLHLEVACDELQRALVLRFSQQDLLGDLAELRVVTLILPYPDAVPAVAASCDDLGRVSHRRKTER
jgi:hypothetical protein